jgi:hypothetical protein
MSVYTVYRLEKIDQSVPSLPYIGCTSSPLNKRLIAHRTALTQHPTRLLYKTILANGGWDAFRIRAVAEIHEDSHKPGVAEQMAFKLESDLIRGLVPKIGCLNERLPMRPKSEQYEIMKEKMREKYQSDPKYRDRVILKADLRYLCNVDKAREYARARYHRLQAAKKGEEAVNASL